MVCISRGCVVCTCRLNRNTVVLGETSRLLASVNLRYSRSCRAAQTVQITRIRSKVTNLARSSLAYPLICSRARQWSRALPPGLLRQQLPQADSSLQIYPAVRKISENLVKHTIRCVFLLSNVLLPFPRCFAVDLSGFILHVCSGYNFHWFFDPDCVQACIVDCVATRWTLALDVVLLCIIMQLSMCFGILSADPVSSWQTQRLLVK